ncbi:hypothetical protein [Formosa maritima]|uniref:Uncharacterized protein n=1 Tax=Formosa maritima TaxID=2592046 RepID=A0A5D0G0M7_9FLAO|nr:hypothetical protein [Formosa maritima]TYA52181.1 hypothetical protein FVF61_12600 [Formosa maritima]
MKFNGLLLIITLLFFSCSDVTENIIENAIPDPETLEVGIKNNTNYRFTRTEIITNNSTYVYQIVEQESYSEFFEMAYIYSEVEIKIQTNNGYFSFTPSHYIEDTKVTKGLYYFEVNISNNETVSLTRKKF